MPIIIKQQIELKFITAISFTPDIAMLQVIDAENPSDVITFTCPMSHADLKGMHAVQNLGAVITYLRRYLYVTAFDIVEADQVDASNNRSVPTQDAPKTSSKPKADKLAVITEEQRKSLVGRLQSEEDKDRLMDILKS